MDTSYWTKIGDIDDNNKILWNLPQQETGILQVVGGNSQNFSAEIKTTEFLNTLDLKEVRLLLPDALSKKIPPISGINFAPSTDSGSFAKSDILNRSIKSADATILSGDFSKNSITSAAMTDAIKLSSPTILNKTTEEKDKLVVITRDAVDSLSDTAADFMERNNLIFVASMAQLQKLFRSLLYPRMIMLSSPIFPVIETLHKFTLSYKTTSLTFHQNQIIIASLGKINTVPIDH